MPGFPGKSRNPWETRGFSLAVAWAVAGVPGAEEWWLAVGRRPGRRVPPGRIPVVTGACTARSLHGVRASLPMPRLLVGEPMRVGSGRRRRCRWSPASAGRRSRVGASACFPCALLTGAPAAPRRCRSQACEQGGAGSRGCVWGTGRQPGFTRAGRVRDRAERSWFLTWLAGVGQGGVPRSDFRCDSTFWRRAGPPGRGGNANKRYRVNVRGYTFFSVPNRADCPAG